MKLLLLALCLTVLFLSCGGGNEAQNAADLRDSEIRLRLLEEMYWEMDAMSGMRANKADRIAIKANLLGLIFQEVVFGAQDEMPPQLEQGARQW